ncbi:MAG: lytic transglycosylase, partial [Eudoraea sp.]|nr:lytic transglycosylase [Eudoraea sp.]
MIAIKKIFSLFFLCACVVTLSAQHSDSEANNQDIKDTTALKIIADSIRSNSKLNTAEPKDVSANVDDGSIVIPLDKEATIQLGDHPEAARYDSLWMKELYDSAQYYEAMYEAVTELDTTGLQSSELDTEVLKERLKALDQKTPFNIEYNPSLE